MTPLAEAPAYLAVPGDLATASGGYAYDRALIAASGGALAPLSLPMLGARPDWTLVEPAMAALAAVPPGRPVLVDGLALATLPPARLAGLDAPLAALIHHPLALEHGLGAEDAAWLADNERAALAACRAVVTTSAATATILVRDYAVPGERLTVAGPGTPRPAGATTRRPSGTPVHLLSVAALVPRKGFDTLVEALAAVPGDWRLTVIGPARDADHVALLHRLTAEHGLAGRIAWVGERPAAEVAAAMARADLFVLASRYEGYGMAYAEALVAGLPVVGCDTGAVAEATRGGALLVPPDDPAALAGALAPLIADPAARAALAARGAKAARALPGWPYTWTAVAGALAPLGLRRPAP
ncbi:MAG: glycosyltransferase family 4 protein [Pseudomonadota bacterium]